MLGMSLFQACRSLRRMASASYNEVPFERAVHASISLETSGSIFYPVKSCWEVNIFYFIILQCTDQSAAFNTCWCQSLIYLHFHSRSDDEHIKVWTYCLLLDSKEKGLDSDTHNILKVYLKVTKQYNETEYWIRTSKTFFGRIYFCVYKK